MGRPSSGALIFEGATRISISYLIRRGYIRKGRVYSGVLSWTNGHNIGFRSHYYGSERYFQLNYTTGSREDLICHEHKIRLASIPSNLGKGEVLYFVCPVSTRLCRFLIFSNHNRMFVCREALAGRAFYESQTSSKLDLENDRYWSIRRKLDRLSSSRKETFIYKGKKTRYAMRVDRLFEKMNAAEERRWGFSSVPASLRREIIRLVVNGGNS